MPNKSLGQHWLHDRTVLEHIADSAEVQETDTILEIGPGLGTLTSVLLNRAEKIVAVEFDRELARKLPAQFPGKNLEVIQSDILSFNLNQLPKNYKVAANVPYYITSKIIKLLMTAENKPSLVVLLIQKEVAERLASIGNKHGILSISAQLFADVELASVVPAHFFTPPPKVDSQVVILRPHQKPLFENFNEQLFFRVVKAGFSKKRKKVVSSIAGGLGMDKIQAKQLLDDAGVDSNSRAENLSIEEWWKITQIYKDY